MLNIVVILPDLSIKKNKNYTLTVRTVPFLFD